MRHITFALLALTLAATGIAAAAPNPVTPADTAGAAANAPSAAAGSPASPRPATWAQPLTVAGVPNLYKVSDRLYRSAQPTAEGMKNLKTMGLVTVINLRSFHSDRDEIGDTGLAKEHLYVKAWHPEEKEIVRFLQIVTDDKRTPALVHCMQGVDRTGAMCAIYRMAVQGWTKEEAIKEMTEGGFGFHEIWKNLVPWLNGLDIEAIKKKAGIAQEKKAEPAPGGAK